MCKVTVNITAPVLHNMHHMTDITGEGRREGNGDEGEEISIPPVSRFTSTNAHDLLPSFRRACKRASVSVQEVCGERRRRFESPTCPVNDLISI